LLSTHNLYKTTLKKSISNGKLGKRCSLLKGIILFIITEFPLNYLFKYYEIDQEKTPKN